MWTGWTPLSETLTPQFPTFRKCFHCIRLKSPPFKSLSRLLCRCFLCWAIYQFLNLRSFLYQLVFAFSRRLMKTFPRSDGAISRRRILKFSRFRECNLNRKLISILLNFSLHYRRLLLLNLIKYTHFLSNEKPSVSVKWLLIAIDFICCCFLSPRKSSNYSFDFDNYFWKIYEGSLLFSSSLFSWTFSFLYCLIDSLEAWRNCFLLVN